MGGAARAGGRLRVSLWSAYARRSRHSVRAVRYGILIPLHGHSFGAEAPEYAAALCHAVNDWVREEIVDGVPSEFVSGRTRLGCNPALAEPTFKYVDRPARPEVEGAMTPSATCWRVVEAGIAPGGR